MRDNACKVVDVVGDRGRTAQPRCACRSTTSWIERAQFSCLQRSDYLLSHSAQVMTSVWSSLKVTLPSMSVGITRCVGHPPYG